VEQPAAVDTRPSRRRSETFGRSVTKAVSYRVLSSTITVSITLAVTGSRAMALSIGGMDFIAKLVGYVLHERAWIWFDRRRTRIGASRPAT
jgi:uncharacterized membrane protein